MVLKEWKAKISYGGEYTLKKHPEKALAFFIINLLSSIVQRAKSLLA
jgi:hypothetical protein